MASGSIPRSGHRNARDILRMFPRPQDDNDEVAFSAEERGESGEEAARARRMAKRLLFGSTLSFLLLYCRSAAMAAAARIRNGSRPTTDRSRFEQGPRPRLFTDGVGAM